MNVLVIGSGGREHALARKLKQSPRVKKLFCAPGNAALAELAECLPGDVSDITMERHGIPIAGFTVCADHGDASVALCAVEWPGGIKAEGLAGGKGVCIADDPDQAPAIIEALMEKRELGAAADRGVIEEHLEGQELSFIVLTAGGRVLGVTARGPDLPAAVERAYSAADKIKFEGMHYRKDIGMRGP